MTRKWGMQVAWNTHKGHLTEAEGLSDSFSREPCLAQHVKVQEGLAAGTEAKRKTEQGA